MASDTNLPVDLVELVDSRGRAVGEMEKLAAHRLPGRWHRAISVLLVNADGMCLLQRRSAAKYHFAGRWANTCCSHPAPGEAAHDAAARCLKRELGIAAQIREVGTIRYEAFDAQSGLVEREHDHVFAGRFTGDVGPDPNEISEVCWMKLNELEIAITREPTAFAPWLRPVVSALIDAGYGVGQA